MDTTYAEGREKEVFHWSDVLYPQHIPLSYSQYIYYFAYPLKAKITETRVNRTLDEKFKVLRLTEQESIGSWFLFLDYTVIWLYAFNNQPNQLPKYGSPLLFSYKVLRKKIVLNEFYLLSKKKGPFFSYPYVISPLIAKNKDVIDALEKEMSSFSFMQDDSWNSDPRSIISQLKNRQDYRLIFMKENQIGKKWRIHWYCQNKTHNQYHLLG